MKKDFYYDLRNVYMAETITKQGVGAWIRKQGDPNHSYFFPLQPENHGKIEIAGGVASPLIVCDSETVGGGVDAGESLETALLREWREERGNLSLSTDQLRKLPDTLSVRQRRNEEWVDFVVSLFLLTLTSEQVNRLTRNNQLFPIPDDLLEVFLRKGGWEEGRKLFRPFTVAFGTLVLNNHFYRN